MNHFLTHSRLVRIVLLAVMLFSMTYLVSPTGTAKAASLHYIITNFYPTSEFPDVTWDMCNHPGGLYPHLPLPNYGYYEVNLNVNTGNIVKTWFLSGSVSFSSSTQFPDPINGLIGEMLPAPAFSLPPNSIFTVTVALYQNSTQMKSGITLMRQKLTFNCTTRVITSNVITYF